MAHAKRCPLAGVSPAEMLARRAHRSDDAAGADDVLDALLAQRVQW